MVEARYTPNNKAHKPESEYVTRSVHSLESPQLDHPIRGLRGRFRRFLDGWFCDFKFASRRCHLGRGNCYLEHSVLKCRCGILGHCAFWKRNLPIKASIASLAAIEAFALLLVLFF